jgi:hypothetical protein
MVNSKFYQIGDEVKKNAFAFQYICYRDVNSSDSEQYTHLRVLKRKGKDQIQMTDVALNGSEENNRKRLLVRRLSSRFKEMDEFLKNCERRKNLLNFQSKGNE